MTFLLILATTTLIFFTVRHFLKPLSSSKNSLDFKGDKKKEVLNCLTPTEFAEKYKNRQGQVQGGTLCFWGHWFGRPYDNFHRIVSVDFDTSTHILTIRFSEQETLVVTNPSDVQEYKDKLQINKADKVHWQWYYYGKTQEPENLFHYDIIRNENTITGSTNTKRFKENWNELTIAKPAVLLT